MSRTKMLLFGLPTWLAALLLSILIVQLLRAASFHWGYPTPSDKSIAPASQPDWRQDQCETMQRTAVVREPQNTWSNFGYVLAGILILFRACHPLGRAVGGELCFVGISSGLYHASVIEPWQTLDVGSIYGALLALIEFALFCMVKRFFRLSPAPAFTQILCWGTPVVGILMGVLRHAVFESTKTFIVLVAILAILALSTFLIVSLSACFFKKLTDAWNGVTVPWDHMILVFVAMLAVAGLGFYCRLTDGHGNPNCRPDGLLQFHACWHVLSAAALLLAYDYFARLLEEPCRVFAGPWN